MPDHSSLLQKLKILLTNQSLCVLSTQDEGHPYANLVAFAVTEDLKNIVFATTRDTRKYNNLMREPHVAVLINNSTNSPRDFQDAMAATALGFAEKLADERREKYLKLYIEKHPHLSDFVQAPNSAIFSIQVTRYFFVSQFQQAAELDMTQ